MRFPVDDDQSPVRIRIPLDVESRSLYNNPTLASEHELKLLKKLVLKSENLKFPAIPGAQQRPAEENKVLDAAMHSKRLAATKYKQSDTC